ncbi:MAG TPA: acetylornithine/succinylornithine family transaminase [Thermoanaerobaculia bacterium]|nr:acetylornithine/succinylornithine family transaminase [Thermoanaerobaculia bacterium]
MTDAIDCATLYARHVLPCYPRAGLTIVRGKGSHVWDDGGKSYLDFAPGLGVCGLGHSHPRVVEAICRQAASLIHVQNRFFTPQQARLAAALTRKLDDRFDARAFFCNSGSEAVETAIKLAKRARPGRSKFVAMERSFHGRTLGAVSATGQIRHRDGFDPLVPGFSHVPLNDTDALFHAVDDGTAAVIIEPVQGEGGVYVCRASYLRDARQVCDEHNALLVYDEVQSGMGRTGDYFAFQTLEAPPPDAVCLAKNLAGGFPIGALLVRGGDLCAALPPGTHGSTYGGNALACAAALAVIETIDSEGILLSVRRIAEHLAASLAEIAAQYADRVVEVRQLGMIAAIEVAVDANELTATCQKRGLLVNAPQRSIVRLLPALTISAAELVDGLAILKDALADAPVMR